MRKLLPVVILVSCMAEGDEYPSGSYTYDSLGIVVDVETVGGFAYIADRLSGIALVDVSDPTNMQIVSEAYTYGSPNCLHSIYGGLLLVCDGYMGITVVDLTDISQPRVISNVDTRGEAMDIALVSNRLMVADGYAGVAIYDASDLLSPSLIGYYDSLLDFAYSLYYYQGKLFVADGDVVILEYINDSLKFVSRIETDGIAYRVVPEGNFIFVADGLGGVKVYDVSSPDSALLVKHLDVFSGEVRDIYLYVDRMYVADFSGFIYVLDKYAPDSIVLRNYHSVAGTPYRLSYKDGYIYVASGTAGLWAIWVGY